MWSPVSVAVAVAVCVSVSVSISVSGTVCAPAASGKCDWSWESGRVPGKMLFNQHLHSMNFEFSEMQPVRKRRVTTATRLQAMGYGLSATGYRL